MRVLLILIVVLFSYGVKAQAVNTINWLTIEEAQEAMKTQPKKVFIDLSTDWCGWCKRMDATTFQDPNVVHFMNQFRFLQLKSRR